MIKNLSLFCGRRILAGALFAGSLALTGCATNSTPPFDYAAFKQARPRSILLLPPTNASPDLQAPAGLMAQAVMPLAESGYYVYPASLVQETFVQNGLTSAADIHALPPTRLGEIFGADAALYIDVKQYGAVYKVIDSETVVAASARLVDLKTGRVLWSGSARASSNEGQRNNSQGLVGILLSAAINQIIANVADASYGVAGTASRRLLAAGQPNGMLYGPRSPRYGTD